MAEKSAKSATRIQAKELQVTSVLVHDENASVDDTVDDDERVLVALGYKQEFKREFSLLSSFSVSFSILGLLPSVASILGYNLGYAGPVGMVWGWIVAAFFIQFIALSMAELCSALPTSGGLYYASAVLAPEGWGPLAAWITGWSNFLGQVTGPAAIDWSLAEMIMACVTMHNPAFTPQTWQLYLLMILLLVIHGIGASIPTKWLARMNIFNAAFNGLALLICLIVLPTASVNTPKTNSAEFVFTSFTNGTGWPDGVAFIMSWLAVIWTMSGYDAPFHLAEEASNANVASPRAIVMTAVTGGVLGWCLMLVLAFTVKDVNAVMNSPVGQPMGSLLLQVLGPEGGIGMFSLILVCQMCMGFSALTAASRVVYAYSRDGALPFSQILKSVNTHTKTPVNAVWFLIIIACLLGCLAFAGPAAIGAIFAMGAVAQYVAFIAPTFLRVFVVGNKFRPGPFNLGVYSKISGTIACCFVLVVIPFMFFPSAPNPTLDTMNWAVAVYGGSMALALVWYAVDAHKWFKGPKVNIQHRIHWRDKRDDSSPQSKSSNEGDVEKSWLE